MLWKIVLNISWEKKQAYSQVMDGIWRNESWLQLLFKN